MEKTFKNVINVYVYALQTRVAAHPRINVKILTAKEWKKNDLYIRSRNRIFLIVC